MLSSFTYKGKLVQFKGGILIDQESGFYNKLIAKAKLEGHQLPSYPQQRALKRMIIDLEKAGILSKLDAFYVFAGDGGVGFKTLNIVNPDRYNAVPYGGLAWEKDGVLGNGANGYLNTQLNIANSLSVGRKYQQTNASVCVVFKSNDAQGSWQRSTLASSYNNGSHQVMLSSTTNLTGALMRINSTNSTGIANPLTGSGFYSISRNNDNNHMESRMDVNTILATRTTSALSGEILLLKYSIGDYYGVHKISCAFIGGYLEPSEINVFRNVFKRFTNQLNLEVMV